MKRIIGWLVVTSSLTAAAEGSSWSQKLDAARAHAVEERNKLGLPNDASLFGKYPTPEISFVADTARPLVCPGASGAIQILGKIAAGSSVVFQSDDVTVKSEHLTPNGWEGTVEVKRTAPPQRVSATVSAPVSFASRSADAFVIGCAHSWKIDLRNGDSLTFKTDTKAGFGVQEIPGEWSRKGKKVTIPLSVTLENGAAQIHRQVSAEEMNARMKAFSSMADSPEMKKLNDKTNALIEKISACSKKSTSQIQGCLAGPQAEMEKLNEQRKALMEKPQQSGGPEAGCDEVSVHIANGQLSGDATQCAGQPSEAHVALTGKITPG